MKSEQPQRNDTSLYAEKKNNQDKSFGHNSSNKLHISNIEVLPVRESMFYEDEIVQPATKKQRDIYIETVDHSNVSVAKEVQDEYTIFGQFVANELRSLNSFQNRKKLKRLIQRSILEISELEEI